MEEAFNHIFHNKVWGVNLDNRPSSGPGSRANMATPFSEFLVDFFQEKKIQNIVDIGCGDFQYMREFDLSNYNYTGVDCVENIVDYNNKTFGKQNIRFIHNDGSNPERLPKGDVYIVKDVLQHWNNDSINAFLQGVIQNRKCRYIIIANCYSQEKDNQEIRHIGDTRFLNAHMNPLKQYKPEVIKTYGTKQISVITVF
jgi:SAM-dependent methyltransferase